jgi:hypothetical protein
LVESVGAIDEAVVGGAEENVAVGPGQLAQSTLLLLKLLLLLLLLSV